MDYDGSIMFRRCVLDLYADGQKPAVGGDAANQAILLSKLGFSTACSARLGQDQEADLILAQLQAHNVKIDWLRRHAGEITTHSRIQLDAQGERRSPLPAKRTAISRWLIFRWRRCLLFAPCR